MTDRDDTIMQEMMKMMFESAALKAKAGNILHSHDINTELVKFIRKYDLYVAFWEDEEAGRALVIRRSLKNDGNLTGNSVPVRDRATAIALHAACRADDNCAPEPPES